MSQRVDQSDPISSLRAEQGTQMEATIMYVRGEYGVEYFTDQALQNTCYIELTLPHKTNMIAVEVSEEQLVDLASELQIYSLDDFTKETLDITLLEGECLLHEIDTTATIHTTESIFSHAFLDDDVSEYERDMFRDLVAHARLEGSCATITDIDSTSRSISLELEVDGNHEYTHTTAILDVPPNYDPEHPSIKFVESHGCANQLEFVDVTVTKIQQDSTSTVLTHELLCGDLGIDLEKEACKHKRNEESDENSESLINRFTRESIPFI